jgi:hypothetical protein
MRGEGELGKTYKTKRIVVFGGNRFSSISESYELLYNKLNGYRTNWQ